MNLFRGESFRGKQHTAYMRKCRQLSMLSQKGSSVRDKYSKLSQAWNGQVLRRGDHAAELDPGPVGEPKVHPNFIGPAGILRTGFLAIGKRFGLRDGISGTHSAMDFMCAAAEACTAAQATEVRKCMENIIADPEQDCLVVSRHYDATPWHVRFGSLHDVLFPHARYLIKEKQADGQVRWKLVPMSVYQGLHPRARLAAGVVEVFAERATMAWYSKLSRTVPEFNRAAVLVPPAILQRANSSVIHAALEKSVPELSIQGIKDYLATGRFCIINDIPDSCNANKRRQRKAKFDMREELCCLYYAGFCAAHLVHRILESATREKN